MTAHLEVRGISKQFNGKHGTVLALDDINLHVEAGEFVCLVGASGCGKSTLLSIIAGLRSQTAGEVLLDGEPVEAPAPTGASCSRTTRCTRGARSRRTSPSGWSSRAWTSTRSSGGSSATST